MIEKKILNANKNASIFNKCKFLLHKTLSKLLFKATLKELLTKTNFLY